MTISDFLQKNKIVIMYLNFWHIIYFYLFFNLQKALPLFYMWAPAPAPEELSASPW